jgi:hypothetical protein
MKCKDQELGRDFGNTRPVNVGRITGDDLLHFAQFLEKTD